MNIKKISLLSIIFVTSFALNTKITAIDQATLNAIQNMMPEMEKASKKTKAFQEEPIYIETEQKHQELIQISKELEKKNQEEHWKILENLEQIYNGCPTAISCNEALYNKQLQFAIIRENQTKFNTLLETSKKIVELIEKNHKDPIMIKYKNHVTQLGVFNKNFELCESLNSPTCFNDLEKELREWNKNN